MCNRHVKFGLKIHNRLGKIVRKNQGEDFFDSHCTVIKQLSMRVMLIAETVYIEQR